MSKNQRIINALRKEWSLPKEIQDSDIFDGAKDSTAWVGLKLKFACEDFTKAATRFMDTLPDSWKTTLKSLK